MLTNNGMSELFSIPLKMTAVYLHGHGGFDQLSYQEDVLVPTLNEKEVLIKVEASSVNNTDINTRIGWYAPNVTSSTATGAEKGFQQLENEVGSWSGLGLKFPLIQGADCCGRVVRVGERVSTERIGERVLVQTLLHGYSYSLKNSKNGRSITGQSTFGSECNGGFAQYTKVMASDAVRVDSDLSSEELSSFPCSYSTAEGMLHRAKVGEMKDGNRDTVLITGASGGVGVAMVQLAKRRGARVVAITTESKAETIKNLGADEVFFRETDLVRELGEESVDVVADVVGGEQFPEWIKLLCHHGRYVTSGAIAGPIVDLDLRKLYLKDLTFYGSTFQESVIFKNLVSYIERKEIRPVVAKSYPLRDIVQAQKDFLAKKHVGKLVLVPPQ